MLLGMYLSVAAEGLGRRNLSEGGSTEIHPEALLAQPDTSLRGSPGAVRCPFTA
jgi:hypothetical protein